MKLDYKKIVVLVIIGLFALSMISFAYAESDTINFPGLMDKNNPTPSTTWSKIINWFSSFTQSLSFSDSDLYSSEANNVCSSPNSFVRWVYREGYQASGSGDSCVKTSIKYVPTAECSSEEYAQIEYTPYSDNNFEDIFEGLWLKTSNSDNINMGGYVWSSTGVFDDLDKDCLKFRVTCWECDVPEEIEGYSGDCTETDDGDDKNEFGVITTDEGVFEEYCIDEDTVAENYCTSGENFMYRIHRDCSFGDICENGECVEGNPVQICVPNQETVVNYCWDGSPQKTKTCNSEGTAYNSQSLRGCPLEPTQICTPGVHGVLTRCPDSSEKTFQDCNSEGTAWISGSNTCTTSSISCTPNQIVVLEYCPQSYAHIVEKCNSAGNGYVDGEGYTVACPEIICTPNAHEVLTICSDDSENTFRDCNVGGTEWVSGTRDCPVTTTTTGGSTTTYTPPPTTPPPVVTTTETPTPTVSEGYPIKNNTSNYVVIFSILIVAMIGGLGYVIFSKTKKRKRR